MIDLPKSECTGCGVCKNICPTGALTMKADDEGFLYPCVNTDLCTSCQVCIDHCPVIQKEMAPFNMEPPLAVYAGWALDSDSRMSGSSGGMFGELAKYILEQGGYAAGAAYTEDHVVRHRIIHRIDELPILKKSKYLQSDTGTVFSDVRRLIEQGAAVLFTGTPCQCAGLLTFLGGHPANLILCDLICHGVNSPLVHKRYIEEAEDEIGEKVTRIDHRDKSGGWEKLQISVWCGDQKHVLGGKRVSPYVRGFLTDMYLRPVCYQCGFKGTGSPTDLTIGDCWGFPRDEPMGVSLILVHSEGGKQLLDQIRTNVWLEDYPLETALISNQQIIAPAQNRYKVRESFFPCWKRKGNLRDTVTELLPDPK